MLYQPKVYTVESVTSGHPDKVCDQISDAILDEYLKTDPNSRVAVESFGGHGLLVIGGEVTSKVRIDPKKIASRIYQEIGYSNKLEIISRLVEQSPDIAQGVDSGGAGDQGIMYGYACDETAELLPQGVVLVHRLTAGLERLRKEKKLRWLKPDGKAQLTIKEGQVIKVLVSTQHLAGVNQQQLHQELVKFLIGPTIGDLADTEVLTNPTGKFIVGGFEADTGLTGRKIMVDTYGGLIPHGGGCFSGKDPTKVDRTGAYMARFVAKNIVANGYAKRCLVSIAYAIGKEEPLMIEAQDEKGRSLSKLARSKFDYRPLAIIERLNLRKPIYQQTAVYGHFGKDGFPWEELIRI